MARPLRIEYEGACYHVMNRGNQRRQVFYNDGDYQLFLDRLGEFTEKFFVDTLCYCCMPNHFHLFLRTAQPNLSRFMQSFLTSFTVTINRRRRGAGHIFQGRFKSQLVESDVYSSVLSRYIHLNPVRVARLKNASVADKRAVLRKWRYSSYPATIGIRNGEQWYDCRALLEPKWGKSIKERMQYYRKYVEQGLVKEIENPFDRIAAQSILGSDSFVDSIKRAYILKMKPSDRREQQSLIRMKQDLTFDDVADIICRYFDAQPDDLLSRKCANRRARAALMYAACNYCRSGESLSEMAKRFGVSLSGLAAARDRFSNNVVAKRKVNKDWKNIETELLKKCKK